MKKQVFKFFLIVIVIVALLAGISSVFIVNEGEYAYVTEFGAIKTIHSEAGLGFKIPFIQDVAKITKMQMIYNVNPSEVLTADKKAMIVDSYSIWRISEVKTFMRTVGNIDEMQKRIDASVYSVIKNIMGRLEQNEIIADTESLRENLNEQITEQVSKQLEGYGVTVKTVEIKRYDLPGDNMDAVYKRMISERSQMAASYKAGGEYEASKIRNETDKKVRIIIGEANAKATKILGEGEAEYMNILQEVYNDKAKAEFYSFYRSLKALKKSLQGEKVLILDQSSPIVDILNNK